MIERVKSAMVGLGTLWVLVLMLVLSVVSLAIMLERAWLYFSLRDDAAALMKDLGRLLRQGDLAVHDRRDLPQRVQPQELGLLAGDPVGLDQPEGQTEQGQQGLDPVRMPGEPGAIEQDLVHDRLLRSA